MTKKDTIYISDQETHDRLLKDYVDRTWKDKDVDVDWEYSGPGAYRIHEHTTGTLPCISLKWEGV